MGKADDPQEIPKGSFAAGDAVRIPNGAEAPLTVFINGVEQREGVDYEVEGREVRFVAPIVKEEINTGRWLAMYLGFFGTYRKDEKVDLQFAKGGSLELRSDVPVIPLEDPSHRTKTAFTPEEGANAALARRGPGAHHGPGAHRGGERR